jgi:hypothetical protein
MPKTEIKIPVRWFIKSVPQPITSPVQAPDLSTPEKRGAYLVGVMGCTECHTPMDKGRPIVGKEFAGGTKFAGPWGTVVAANITPDATGISYYDEALFLKVMTTGNLGGRRLAAIMPFDAYRGVDPQDLKAIWAFLKTLPPVKNEIPHNAPPDVKPNPEITE